MSGASTTRSAGVTAARFGLVVGGLVCLLITPQFATAYYFAYGRSAGDPPTPDWLAGVGWPNWFDGSDAITEYKSYGVVFGLSLLLVAVSLGVVLRGRAGKRGRERRAWSWIVVGLGAVGLGALSEYGIPEDVFDPSNGFMLELLGFLIVALGTVVLGRAFYRDSGLGAFISFGVAMVGLISVVAGVLLVRHIPSGPAALLIITAVTIGAFGLPNTSST